MLHLPENVATVAIVGFLVLEAVLRKGKAAKSWQSESDRGTTFLLLLAYLVIGAALSLRLPGPRLIVPVQWFGVLFAFAGLALRVVAFRTLGPVIHAPYASIKIKPSSLLESTGSFAIRDIFHRWYSGWAQLPLQARWWRFAP